MQQAGGNVPLMTVVSSDADGLLVEAQQHTFHHATVRGLKTDSITLGKTNHQRGSPSLENEFEPFNDHAIEEEQVFFVQPLDRLGS